MSDLISREALCEYALNQKDKSVTPNDIMRFPSAQPETHDKRTETHACDLIDREAAIEAMSESLKRVFPEHRQIAEKCLKALPSAQSERQKGEWIDYTEDGYVECPFCHSATNCDGNKDELHFCFSCGADMRGEQDGNT